MDHDDTDNDAETRDTRDTRDVRARVLADFEGRWRIERRITQHDGPPARFDGQAVWSPEGDALRYMERGELRIEGQRAMQAERRYLWRADLSVWFEDGRFFHRVPPGGGDAAHWCAPDAYDVSYDFALWPRFRVVWRVRGPRKDYTMTSTYAPL